MHSYAPVLRPLRREALMITMSKPALPRLMTRLQDICRIEGLDTDMKALVSLIELTDSDMRSCLNTLQVRRGASAIG